MHVTYSGHFVLYVSQSTRLALPNTAIYLWVPNNKTSGQVGCLSQKYIQLVFLFFLPTECLCATCQKWIVDSRFFLDRHLCSNVFVKNGLLKLGLGFLLGLRLVSSSSH